MSLLAGAVTRGSRDAHTFVVTQLLRRAGGGDVEVGS